MDQTHGERGTTLIEVVVAASLLVTLATGTASLILLGHRLGARAAQAMAATTLAAARLEALRAIPWEYAIGGDGPEVAALAYAPSDALDRNTPGLWQATDEAGRPAGMAGSSGAAFVVRWAVWPLSAGPPDARAIEVCVFAWPGVERTPPLACLASARARQP